MKPIFVVLALLLSSCFDLSKNEKLTDSEIKKHISGGWAEYVDNENKIQVYSGYMENGTYHSYGYVPPTFETYVYADGKWEVENGFSCITINYDSLGIFPSGEKICNKVIKINNDVFIFESYGKEIEMKRIHHAGI